MLDMLPSFAPDEAIYNGKSFAERITGRFYTPHILAADLAEQMVNAFAASKAGQVIRVVDPFCGDGRLIGALLARAAEEPLLACSRWCIALWDQDELATAAAKRRIIELAANLGLPASVMTHIGDSFAAKLDRSFDFVITNPPWELLKPDRRELAHLTLTEREQYKRRLRQLSAELDERFSDAKGANAWGGWGTNLARCGWDLSMRLLKQNGVLGIVLPSTLFADQSSEQLRRKAFTKYRIIDMAAYPAEARLFDRVDQPVVSVAMTTNPHIGCAPRLRVFDGALRQTSSIGIGNGDELAKRGYSISVGFGASGAEVFDLIGSLPRLTEFEGSGGANLWLGRELDETRVAEKLTSGSAFPFIKGRMIDRHAIIEAPRHSVRHEFASRFASLARPRVVWRDVSRSSQKRRMIGAVIPQGWVAGNSLHVGFYRDGDLERTRALHGILSSFVLEFQVRSRLATGHMSLGVVREAHVPELDSRLERRLSEEVGQLRIGFTGATDRLEVLVAQAYGLDRDAFAVVLDCFDKITGDEKERLLDKQLWKDAYRLRP